MQTAIVPLSALRQRRDFDARTEEAPVADLVASIEQYGLQSSLLVCAVEGGADPQGYDVVAGSRRLCALQTLFARTPEDAENYMVPVIVVSGSSEEMRERSLVENVMRQPMHPIDECECFAELGKRLSLAEIASRFHRDVRDIEQRLALGSLAPEIIQEWRAKNIDDDSAQALTLAGSHETQLSIFHRLKKRGQLYAHMIRTEAGASDETATRAVRVVGLDAYRAAGGTVTEDLFGADLIVGDKDLAARLLRERMTQLEDELKAEGWAYAVHRPEVKSPYLWGHLSRPKIVKTSDEIARIKDIEAKIKYLTESDDDDDGGGYELIEELRNELAAINTAAERRAWKPAAKKRGGVFYQFVVGNTGTVRTQFEFGVIDPKIARANEKAKQKDARAQAQDAGVAPPDSPLSKAMVLALSEQVTLAAADVVANSPKLALALLVASITARWGTGPMKIRTDGLPALRPEPVGEMEWFHEVLPWLLQEADGDFQERISDAIASGLDLRKTDGQGFSREDLTLLKVIGPAMRGAILQRFDRGSYFKGVSAALCNDALDAIGFKGDRPAKKAALVSVCVEETEKALWLPGRIDPDVILMGMDDAPADGDADKGQTGDDKGGDPLGDVMGEV